MFYKTDKFCHFGSECMLLTEPTEGIAVSYAEIQDSHSRDQLNKVVSHALSHDGYVGGWLPVEGKVAEIVERGTLLVGTTGDYRPLSFCEADGTYWGFGIEVAKEIASYLGVGTAFVKTSWPTLTADVQAEPQTFDQAIGGITITDARRETMLMSEGYLANGKTILCRATEADRFRSLADIEKPEVRVMVNECESGLRLFFVILAK